MGGDIVEGILFFLWGDTLERTLWRGYCGGDTVEGMHKGAWVKYQNDMAWFLFGNRLIFLGRLVGSLLDFIRPLLDPYLTLTKLLLNLHENRREIGLTF